MKGDNDKAHSDFEYTIFPNLPGIFLDSVDYRRGVKPTEAEARGRTQTEAMWTVILWNVFTRVVQRITRFYTNSLHRLIKLQVSR